MSMSSLSAQLAAIHASGKNSQLVGSTLATSRRHEDAIGRGLSHSAKLGHAILTDNNGNALRKPSVIYPNSKTAADVPLTILRENAVTSLYQLTKLTGNTAFSDVCYIQTLCGLASLQFERGLALPKENDAMDLIIRDLLYLLSSAMAQERPSPIAVSQPAGGEEDSLMITSSTTSCFSSCLHVLEYLVRRYDLHTHSLPLIEHWLMSLLPHHEHALFLRVLQLVDLASLPNWIFLRPYAATLTTTSVTPPPTRSYLARHVSQHTALVQQVAQLAQRMGQIHAKEVAAATSTAVVADSSWPPLPTRRGVSHVLSFCAAILVEALQWQSTKTGTLDEATVRILLPYLLTACGGGASGSGDNSASHDSKNKKHKKQLLQANKWSLSVTCPEYRGWGHVLASCMVELGVLSAEVQQVLLHTLMQGALELDRACSNAHANPRDPRRVETAADSILVLLSVLARLPHSEKDEHEDDENDAQRTFLPKVAALASQQQQQQASLVMGFPRLAFNTIKALSEWDAFVPAVAYLHSHMDMEVTNLVAAVLVVALQRIVDVTMMAKKVKRAVAIILELIQEEGLATLWTDPRTCLTSSFASAVVTAFSKWQGDNEEGEESILTFIRSILDALRQVHPRGVDDGVAHAVFGTQQGKHRKSRRKRMAVLLGVRSTKQLPSSKDVHEQGGPEDMDVDYVLSTGNLLPPRVALEHADATIRLEAVQRAVQETKDGVPNLGGSLEEALLRRFWVDDNIQVALAAGKALCDLLHANNIDRPFSETFAEVSLSALYRWISLEGTDPKQQSSLVGLALKLVCYSIQPCATMEMSGSSWPKVQCCMEAIVAHTENSLGAEVRTVAMEALKVATGGNGTQPTATARDLFFSNAIATKGLKNLCDSNSLNSHLGSGENALEITLRKRYMWVIVHLLSEALRDGKDASLADIALDCCLVVIRDVGTANTGSEHTKILRKCLEKSVKIKSKSNAKEVPSILVSIASSGQDVIYESVCLNAVQAACKNVVDKANKSISTVVVVLEACLRPGTPTLAIERLLSVVLSQSSSHEDVIVPLLALLAHPEQPVRSLALQTISSLSGSTSKGLSKDFLKAASASKSSIIMDGASALPKLLALAIRGAESKEKAAEFLLTQCVFAASSSATGSQSSDKAWVSLEDAPGGNRAASIVLSACELAGEQSFPLTMRWKHAGERLFSAMLGIKCENETPITLIPLMETVVRMLKGVVVDEHSSAMEASNVIISSGPNVSGTRSRSYSVGKIDGVTFVKTFPKSMGHAIRDCLASATDDSNSSETALHLVQLVIEECLGRESWGTGIFSKLERPLQQQIALKLLNAVDGEIGDVAASAFRNLPVKTRDLAYLLAQLRQNSDSLSKISLIAEVVQSRAPLLFNSSNCAELTTAMFDLLGFLSSEAAEYSDADGLEFVRHSLLLALHEVLELVAKSSDVLNKSAMKRDELIDHAKSLVHLLSDNGSSTVRSLISHRARSTAIAVLATTCSLLPPNSVLTLLVSTMSMLITDAGAGNQLQSLKLAMDFVAVVVPVYCQLAIAANLSLGHLFSAFVTASKIVTQETERIELFGCLVRAIHSNPAFDGENTPCGALLAIFFSKELETGFVASILAQHFSPIAQLSAVEELVNIVNGILASSIGRSQQVKMTKKSPLAVSFQDIEIMAGCGSEGGQVAIADKPEQEVSVLTFSCRILSSVVEALSSGALRKAIRARVGSASKICLRLWQDLLLLQSSLNCNSGNQTGAQETRILWDSCTNLADDALHVLQALLPADVFLAAVSTLMMDDTTDELQSRSLRLVADRVSGVDPSSAEASLFLEQMPKFVEVMEKTEGYLVLQSALVATEKMARSLRLGSGQHHGTAKEITDFVLALERASAILDKYSKSLTDKEFQSEDESLCQLVSSAALASATFVRVVAIRCLPVLPKLVTSLLAALSSANGFMASHSSIQVESKTTVSIVQISAIRALTGLCDVVPQFLGPYLRQLLSPSTMLSGHLYLVGKDRDLGVKTEAELLLSTISNRIPSRQLVPCVAHAISQCQDVKEVCILMAMVKRSIDLSSQSDATSQRNNLVRSLMLAYEFESDERDHLLNAANELLLAYVLKLSEAQLLSLYAQLRDWRGELDKLNPEANADRRYAFWRLSSVLTKELKSLFLPCLSTATSDAIDELNVGARSLCISSVSQKGHSGKKKRKLDSDDQVEPIAEYGVESLQTLEPLVACLESALKADARDGGKWVRADDGQRYNSLLEPLGKLLQCRLSPELQVLAGRNVFSQLVLGTEAEGSNIVDCLTALAAAAGNEQLWKPLNHHILEACGNESRSEVRKAGISCLLKVIRTIGDEYMVLLPECLPVLSELLEDADEDNVALAQECVALGEELLGESLQDSLR